jgi:hypothetical protein
LNARLTVLLPTLLLVSCVHKYAVPAATQSQVCLPAAATVYIITPEDGRDDRPRTYEGSGDWTRSAVAKALRDRGMRVLPGGTTVELSEAIAAAGAANADFLVYPKIVHWSDRVTEWSGIPDRITLNMRIYEVATGKVVNRQEIEASSRWATFGGDHPQDLLPELMRRWAETLTE